MTRYIDADALIDAYCNGCTHYRGKICRSAQRCDFESFCNEYINTMPTVDAQDGWCYVHNEVLERMGNGYPSTETRPDWCPLKEVKHGKWIKADSQQYFRKHYPCFTCSECGYRKDSQKKWNYCPNCGARMDEDGKTD